MVWETVQGDYARQCVLHVRQSQQQQLSNKDVLNVYSLRNCIIGTLLNIFVVSFDQFLSLSPLSLLQLCFQRVVTQRPALCFWGREMRKPQG